jgi:uncharacterized protein DUF3307
VTIPVILLAIHFVADFILQSDWMATNKSKNWRALLCHTALYALCFSLYGWAFVFITFALHTLTDAITSKITSYLWKQNARHWFFVVIGADQLIHYGCLAWTLNWLF